MQYNRLGKSGLKLPAVSLGFWHNFGDNAQYSNMKELCFIAFDNGITHFDLANNYGPASGSAEENFGKIFANEMRAYRDEMIISTKAGYEMWPGPYGCRNGSRKYLLASLDQSLKRMGLEYVDIFYHHCLDPETPLEETMGALAQAVRSGKALYAGVSNYDGENLEKACSILEDLKCPFVINQNRYSIFTVNNREQRSEKHRRKAEQGHYRLQSARARVADRQIPERHPERQQGYDRRQIPLRQRDNRRETQKSPRAFGNCKGEKPDPCRNGTCMGAERRNCQFRFDRRVKAVANPR